jgi:hypothetical protein
MARQPATALHARLAAIGSDVRIAFQQEDPVFRVFTAIDEAIRYPGGAQSAVAAAFEPVQKSLADVVAQQRAQLEAVRNLVGRLDRLDRLEREHRRLWGTVWLLIRQADAPQWLLNLLRYGFDPERGVFVDNGSERNAALLRTAGYADITAIANIKATRGKRPWQKLHEDMTKAYDQDKARYEPPPPPDELKSLYEVCAGGE